MNNKKIVYLQQLFIPDTIGKRIQEIDPSYNLESQTKILQLASAQSFYSRAGDNTLPFCFGEIFIDSKIPTLDHNYNKTFEEVTDQRCKDLLSTCHDRPWVISWSGGIDSTVILCSLLKNLPRAELDRITVSCNHLSVFENPVFFHRHVVPNFKIINSTNLHLEPLINSHYVIDGNPADLLQGSGLGLLAQNSGLRLDLPWQQQSGPLIDFLSSQLGVIAAEWFYSRMEKNILSLSGPEKLVDTLADWFWWVNFNWKWVGDNWLLFGNQHFANTDVYFKHYKNWYDSIDYQLWSIKQGRYSLIADGTNPGDYKKASKRYIYDYDCNQYYYKFKTKTHSTARVDQKSPWLCLLNDGTTLSADRDLDHILELLPAHLNSQ